MLGALLGEGGSANAPLPSDFPRDSLLEIAVALTHLPQGTAEGCRPVLAYARQRLPAIRREHFPTGPLADAREADADRPPSPLRGGTLDAVLAQLIASVTTAFDEYRRLAAEPQDETEEPESSVAAGGEATIPEAIAASKRFDEALGQARDDLAQQAIPGSLIVDQLQRQVVDAENVSRSSRAELRLKRIVPGWLRPLAQSLKKAPDALRKTAAGLRVGIDIAEEVHGHVRKVSSVFKEGFWTTVYDQCRKTTDLIVWIANRLATASKAPMPQSPPPDFDLEKAHEMISAGIPVPLSWRPWIDELFFIGLSLSDVSPLASLTGLTSLYLSDTAVSDVSPLAGLTGLTTLDLSDTAVRDVSPLAGLTGLTTLDLSDTAVSDVSPLASLTGLTSLYLSDTAVRDVSPLAGLTGLTTLDLSGTAVSDVSPLAGLTGLTSLHLDSTAVSDVSPLAGLTGLTSLFLSDTAVSDVSPLAGLTGLTSLYLGGIAVSDVSALAGLTGLTSLDLNSTAVSDVSPLAGLTGLTTLYLNRTAVSDLSSLKRLPQLRRVYVETEARRSSLAKSLGRRGIVKVFGKSTRPRRSKNTS